MDNRDIKELLQEITRLIKKIEKFKTEYENVCSSLKSRRSRFEIERELSNLYDAKIQNKEYKSYGLEIFCNDFRYKTFGEQNFNYITQLYNSNIANVKKLITDLKKYVSPILRFLSKKIKNSGEESFNDLKLFVENYGATIDEYINNTNSLSNIKFEDLLNEYKESELLQNELSNFINENKRDFSVRLINESIANFKRYISNLHGKIPDIEHLKTNVKKKVDRVVSEELQRKLAEVTVDELNKDKSGIRISALRANGIETLKKLYGCTPYSLENMEGIGSQSAFIIYEKYKLIEEDLLKTIRLKINVDRKTKEMTDLLKATIGYYLKYQNIELMKSQISKIEDATKTYIRTLLKCNYTYLSLSMRDEELLELKEAKEFIDNIKKDETSKEFKNIEKEVNKSNKFTDSELWEFFSNNSIAINKILEEIVPELFSDDEETFYGLPAELAQQIQDECFFPDGLLCNLRKYQEWGVKYILHQERVLLGDEMGLGKTIQAIAAMVSQKNLGAKHFLVVCPASLVINWIREISKHSKLTPFKIHGNGKSSIFKNWQIMGGVGVTTYEALGTLEFPENFKISQLIVDEAHYIKNINAKRSQNTIKVSNISERVLFMTGTPLENNVDEMISLIEILQPKIAEEVKPFAYSVAASRFREMIIPVYYRRKRIDVLTELPDLIEKEEWCTMGSRELDEYYSSLANDHYMTVRRLSWNVDDLEFSSKALRLREIIDEAKEEGRKVIVFSYFIEVIYKIYMFLKGQCMLPITGKVSALKRQNIIDQFTAAEPGKVLLSQIVAGGTGLNLQTASVVVLCEPQIKPSIEEQAISRAYRMGQTRNVLVFKLLCEDTIDERIQDILEQKREEFMLYADKSLAAETFENIDDTTMGKIIEEEIERIKKEKNIDVKTYKSKEKNNNVSTDLIAEILEETSKKLEKTNKEYLPTDNYYENLLKLSYSDIVTKLLEKYGAVRGDYFLDDISWTINDSIKKGSIGLSIHHIDEDKYIKLSDQRIAKLYNFEFQRKNRLVYCDILEHLILHIKIAIENIGKSIDYKVLVGIGGAINYLIPQINDIYSDKEFTRKHDIENRKRIKDYFDSYIKVLQYLLREASKNLVLKDLFDKDTISKTFEGRRLDKVYLRLN